MVDIKFIEFNQNMNKENLAELVVAKLETSKKKAKELIEEIFDTIAKQLAKGGEFAISGFGTFKVSSRAARKGINPRTGERISIPATRVPKFRAAKNLKERVK